MGGDTGTSWNQSRGTWTDGEDVRLRTRGLGALRTAVIWDKGDVRHNMPKMIGYLRSLLTEPWKPISRSALAAWLVFYAGFLAYAFSAHGGYLFIDSANLVVHEGGHNLFGWFGPTLGLWGGTLLQWLVPFLLAAYFLAERQIAGFVFCSFFFFENWLYTATYMADARAQQLPLVTTGDPDVVEHDFHAIFSSLGVLNYDTKIAAVVRVLGWCGMIGCVVWLAARAWAQVSERVSS